MNAKPFLKWAGGKGQLLQQLEPLFPEELKKGRIRRYVEPFVGAGAVLFRVLQQFKPEQACLSDVNPDLVQAYRVVRRRCDELIDVLTEYQRRYAETPAENRNDLFLEIRAEYNAEAAHTPCGACGANDVRRTARLIFLNKTCFNGLFRLNAKGGFNVPFGGYESPAICDAENLKAAGRLLAQTEIECGDFSLSEKWADDDSFFYFDPPYRPLSATSSFTTYAGSNFTEADQVRLARFFAKLDREKGVKAMASNSYSQDGTPNDDFYGKHYGPFHKHIVFARRAINSKGEKRGKIAEIVITNYPKHEAQRAMEFNF
mgnify:CR=1 FL=1